MSGKDDKQQQKKDTQSEKELQDRRDYEMNDMRKAYKERYL